MMAPPITREYPTILTAVWNNNNKRYHFETVEMEPIRMGEESVIAMFGEYQVLVLDGLDDLFLCLFLEELLLAGDLGYYQEHDAIDHVVNVTKGFEHLLN